ncbi:MAG: anion transporter [Methanosarcina sp.]|uniref:anion transporter n=1 Tax=Methanosarcina sp. TaxID=2213 RepID=UPI00263842F7|nr:anion transporter [Methanosarcina sp.]MDD3245266.1 anion transporter [Methanosarcina sp.]MDD4248874.1 anion transporter [Methanosarcina sp.]
MAAESLISSFVASPDLSVLVLMGVLLLIALRQVGSLRLQIWQVMTLGAFSVLLLGEISPQEALRAINLDVLLFLFGAFCVGEALNRSGYLAWLGSRIVSRAKNTDQLVLLVIFSTGILSAVLMNDTLAIMGTPLVLRFSRKYGVSPKLMLFALAFGITTGSVMSPIGNPQNLLIAIDGNLDSPFVTFLSSLALPTLINLLIAYAVLRLCFSREFGKKALIHSEEVISDPELAEISKKSLFLLLALITCKIILVEFLPSRDFSLSLIALLSASPILLSKRRTEVVKNIDWTTLVFFVSMFVLMESVWISGTCQELLGRMSPHLGSVPMILALSIGLSQLISNVPFVALYLPAMGTEVSQVQLMALAAGSTIAGNFLILGAASNVIILQNAEKDGETFSFIEFARIGLLISFLDAIIYFIFLLPLKTLIFL